MQKFPKVLFICKKRIDSYGISFGLLNSSTFIANKLNKCKIESKVVSVVDANSIDREVFNYNPTHVFIEALWVTPDKINELINKWKKVKWIIRIHSKIPFLANEGIAFKWICEYKNLITKNNNFCISGNSILLNDDLISTIDIRSVYLPNVYCVSPNKNKKIHRRDRDVIDIGCFGALRPLKNHMNQAIAAVKFGNDLGLSVNFHINGDRIEQKGDEVLKNLKSFFNCGMEHNLVMHSWKNHNDFINLVKNMDLGMQVSFSETFNIVSADFVWNGIPMIMGKDIDWAPNIFKADPNDSNDIVRKLKYAWYGRLIGLERLNKIYLDSYNYIATDIWLNYLLNK